MSKITGLYDDLLSSDDDDSSEKRLEDSQSTKLKPCTLHYENIADKSEIPKRESLSLKQIHEILNPKLIDKAKLQAWVKSVAFSLKPAKGLGKKETKKDSATSKPFFGHVVNRLLTDMVEMDWMSAGNDKALKHTTPRLLQ